MAISKQDIENIRNSVNIVDIIKEYLPDLKKAGKDYKTLCPFHNEKTPSFLVSPQKNIFHCFGCNIGGDVFSFIMKYENISYPEAVKKIAKKIGIKIKDTWFDTQESDEIKIIMNILFSAAKFYNKYLLEEKDAQPAREYLLKRKINNETIKKFMLGFAPLGNKILNLASKKYDMNLLFKTGLIGISEKNSYPHDCLYNRIVFPIFDFQGNIVGFGGRILPEFKENQPVYLNTQETSVFNKSRILYGLYQAYKHIKQQNQTILFEGYIDVLINHQYGLENSVAPLGTSFTEGQLRILKRFCNTIVVVFDSDEGGIKGSLKVSELCFENEVNCRIVCLPQKIDPDEYILINGKEKFIQLIENSLTPIEFKILTTKYDINKPEQKSSLIKELLEMICKIKDSIVRYEMIKNISTKFDLKEEILLSEMHKIMRLNKLDFNSDFSKQSKKDIEIFSAEEEIIYLCLYYPNLIKIVPEDIFSDERCIRIFKLISKNSDSINIAELVNSIDEDTSCWLRKLIFVERQYTQPELILKNLIKDLMFKKEEEKRRTLEIEIVPMLEGKIPVDLNKLDKYHKLTKVLKGTVGRR